LLLLQPEAVGSGEAASASVAASLPELRLTGHLTQPSQRGRLDMSSRHGYEGSQTLRIDAVWQHATNQFSSGEVAIDARSSLLVGAVPADCVPRRRRRRRAQGDARGRRK
jgi:hypothetical protein